MSAFTDDVFIELLLAPLMPRGNPSSRASPSQVSRMPKRISSRKSRSVLQSSVFKEISTNMFSGNRISPFCSKTKLVLWVVNTRKPRNPGR